MALASLFADEKYREKDRASQPAREKKKERKKRYSYNFLDLNAKWEHK